MFSCSGLLHVFLSSSFRHNQHGLAQLVEKELSRVSQQLDKLIQLHQHESHRLPHRAGLNLHTGEAPSLCLLKNDFKNYRFEDKASGLPSGGRLVKRR